MDVQVAVGQVAVSPHTTDQVETGDLGGELAPWMSENLGGGALLHDLAIL